MRAVPTYRIVSWRQTQLDELELRYRPTLRTVLQRLGITVVCILLAGLLEWGLRDLRAPSLDRRLLSWTSEEQREIREVQADMDQSMRDILGTDEYERLQQEVEDWRQQQARQQQATQGNIEWLGETLDAIHFACVGFLLFAGVLAPLSCLWNRVCITRTRRDEVAISSFFLWPRTTYWTLDDFYAIRTFAMERYGFRRRGGLLYHHWEWVVQLSLKGRPNLPFLGTAGVAFGEVSPQFIIFQEKSQPAMLGKAPEPVRELVKGLRAITGLKAEPPQCIDGRIVGRRKVAYNATLQEAERTPVAHEKQVFRTGDPIPDELRARIAEMTGDRVDTLPDGVMRSVTQRIVVKDESGRERTYDSIDDLPDEIRKRLGL